MWKWNLVSWNGLIIGQVDQLYSYFLIFLMFKKRLGFWQGVEWVHLFTFKEDTSFNCDTFSLIHSVEDYAINFFPIFNCDFNLWGDRPNNLVVLGETELVLNSGKKPHDSIFTIWLHCCNLLLISVSRSNNTVWNGFTWQSLDFPICTKRHTFSFNFQR